MTFYCWDIATENDCRERALSVEADTPEEAAENAARAWIDDRDWPDGHSYDVSVVRAGSVEDEPDRYHVTPDAEAMAKVDITVTEVP